MPGPYDAQPGVQPPMHNPSLAPTGAQPNTAAWRTFAGERVVVYAAAGTHGAKRAPAVAKLADRAVEALERLLSPSPEQRGGPVPIYLVDPIAALPGEGNDGAAANGRSVAGSPAVAEAVVLPIEPERPDAAVLGPLTRLLIGRWFGRNAASPGRLIDGIAGVLAGRVGVGPGPAEAAAAVRGELEAGKQVSIVGSAPEGAAGDPSATAFVGWLIQAHKADGLRRFLVAYDPDRRDQAATQVFQKPLGGLEEDWLASLQRRPSGRDALRVLLGQLVPMMRPYRWRQVELIAYMAFGLTYALLLPLSTRYLVDDILPDGSGQRLLVFILGLFVIYVLNALVGMRRAYVTSWISQRLLVDLADRMFAHLQRLSHGYYVRAKVGDLMARLSGDLMVVQMAMAQLIGVALYLLLTAIAAGVTIILLSPLLGALVLVIVPLFAVSYLALRGRIQEISFEQQELTGATAATAQENLSAHAVIKAFGLEKQAEATYHGRLQAMLRATLRLMVASALYETSMSLATTLGQLVVLGVGGYMVMEGNLTLGTLLAFIGLLPALFTPIAALSNIGQTVQKASGSLQRITELLDEPIDIADKPSAVALPVLSQGIRLEDVTFGYEPGRPILRDLSLTIPAGASVAVVGPSGCGKSTLINLLLALLGSRARPGLLRRPRRAGCDARLASRSDRPRLPGDLRVRHDGAREHRHRPTGRDRRRGDRRRESRSA